MRISEVYTDEPDILVSETMSLDNSQDYNDEISDRLDQLRALSMVSLSAGFQAHDNDIKENYLWAMDKLIREVALLN